MTIKRRKFNRPLGERRYKKLFVIATEGQKTEPHYFSMFSEKNAVVQVTCLKAQHASSPPQVLKRMAQHLRLEKLQTTDEAWLVVDQDQWTEEQLGLLHQWASGQANFGLALSNPKFEFWLLLHFEDAHGLNSQRACTERLKQWLPDYDKGIDTRRLKRAQVKDAIRRAKSRDHPPCPDWPRTFGQSTVYRLVEKIHQAQEDA